MHIIHASEMGEKNKFKCLLVIARCSIAILRARSHRAHSSNERISHNK